MFFRKENSSVRPLFVLSTSLRNRACGTPHIICYTSCLRILSGRFYQGNWLSLWRINARARVPVGYIIAIQWKLTHFRWQLALGIKWTWFLVLNPCSSEPQKLYHFPYCQSLSLGLKWNCSLLFFHCLSSLKLHLCRPIKCVH